MQIECIRVVEQWSCLLQRGDHFHHIRIPKLTLQGNHVQIYIPGSSICQGHWESCIIACGNNDPVLAEFKCENGFSTQRSILSDSNGALAEHMTIHISY